MDRPRATRHAARYLLVWTLATAAGLALVGAGLAFGGREVYDVYVATGDVDTAVLTDAAPGLALAVAGVLGWRFLTTYARYRTLGAALTAELAETYDTDQVKSEILEVLDGRLADMQQDLQGVNRALRDRDGDGGTETDPTDDGFGVGDD